MESRSSEFQAFYCPNCHVCLNEWELEIDEHELAGTTQLVTSKKTLVGTSVTCGWCGERTNDWGHIKRCRSLRELQFHNQAVELHRLILGKE